jgi:cytoskeletal protein RodZ
MAALPRCCEAIGAQLADARMSLQVSVEDVASKLMLSRGQVVGLEQADASAFYNHAYFLKALRKYMAYIGMSQDLLDEEPDDSYGLRMTLAEMPPRSTAGRWDGWWHGWQALATGVAVVVIGVGAYRYIPLDPASAGRDTMAVVNEVDLLPAQPIGVAAAVPRSVRASPASAVLVASREESTVRVTVGKATWIFVRYPDNRVVERRLAAGDELHVGPLPVYLAVGTADSVEMRIEDRPVALEPYIRDGQIRITRPELARLVP